MIALQDLINWCDAWLDDYYDNLIELGSSLTPYLVTSIKQQLEELQRIKEQQGNAG